ncbi:carboxylesterase/lipase family protein [Streptomyces sp. L7]
MTAERMNPVVGTPYGAVRGRYENGIAVFRGIPVRARPPSAPHRFRPPVPPEPLGRSARRARLRPDPAETARTPTPSPNCSRTPSCRATTASTSNVVDPGTRPGRPAAGDGLVARRTRSPGAPRPPPVYDGHAFARDGVVFVLGQLGRLGVEGYGSLPGRAPASPGTGAISSPRGAGCTESGRVRSGRRPRPDPPSPASPRGAISAGALCLAARAGRAWTRTTGRPAERSPEAFWTCDKGTWRMGGARMATRLQGPRHRRRRSRRAVGPRNRCCLCRARGRRRQAQQPGARRAHVRDRHRRRTGAPRPAGGPSVDGQVARDVDLLMGWTRDEYRLWSLVPGGLHECVDRLGAVALAGRCDGPLPLRSRGSARLPRPAPEAGHRQRPSGQLVILTTCSRYPLHRLADARPGNSHSPTSSPGSSNLPDLGSCHALELGFVLRHRRHPRGRQTRGVEERAPRRTR